MRLLNFEAFFPKLSASGYDKTSDQTVPIGTPGTYNCIAYAASDTRCWWWPHPDTYWPPWSNCRDASVKCFVYTFMRLGYWPCKSSRREFGYEKVALYAVHRSGREMIPPPDWRDLDEWMPKHMARQLPNGSWSSKCGGDEDIMHVTLDALDRYGRNGDTQSAYGCACVYMKRFNPMGRVVGLLQRILWKFEKV